MRASRLLSMLLVLQRRGHATAQDLADELGVSIRTIYRDAEALSSAGIPLYGSAGPSGGYRLVDGFRTHLTGLTTFDAQGLFLTGLAGPASEIGLGTAVQAVERRIAAAVPMSLADEATRVQERVHLDYEGWYAQPDKSPYLTAVARAVLDQRRLRVTYRRWAAPYRVHRVLEPYGLVLKGGHWYLVARREDSFRTYRVDQMVALDVLEEEFRRVEDFDLPRYWERFRSDFQERLMPGQATIRLTAKGACRLRATTSAHVIRAMESSGKAIDDEGTIEAVIPIESIECAAAQLLTLGADVEVLEPSDLRQLLADTALAVMALYGSPTPRHALDDRPVG